MPHLVPLLIRGINNLSDARYCAGMGADKITFLLDPTLPDHLDAKAVKELTSWIAGVELIGEFDQLSAPEINALAAECGLDAVLLRSHRSAADLAEIAPPVYLELTYEVFEQMQYGERQSGWTSGVSWEQAMLSSVAGWVLELPMTIPLQVQSLLDIVSHHRPLWLGTGLNPERARSLALQLPLAGLVFPAGDEVKPGLRDFDQLEAVFEALETE